MERQVYPDQDGANTAAWKGQLDVLRWLVMLKPRAQRVYPSERGADRAVANGSTQVLEWLRRKGVIAH